MENLGGQPKGVHRGGYVFLVEGGIRKLGRNNKNINFKKRKYIDNGISNWWIYC